MGVTKTRARAKLYYYWPGILRCVEDYVLKWLICEKYRPSNIKEPMLFQKLPNIPPFTMLAADICDYGNNSYLVFVIIFNHYHHNQTSWARLQACSAFTFSPLWAFYIPLAYWIILKCKFWQRAGSMWRRCVPHILVCKSLCCQKQGQYLVLVWSYHSRIYQVCSPT